MNTIGTRSRLLEIGELAASERELHATEALKVTGGGAKGGLFEVEDYSFDIEQTLNIGSQSGGTGGSKPRRK